MSEPKILIVPQNQGLNSFNNIGNEFETDLEEENEFNQLFMLQGEEDLVDKIDNQVNLEPLCLSDNNSGGFNNINLQNNSENESKGNPQGLISKKTISFIKKYFREKEDKDFEGIYKYITNDEVNAVEEFEKNIEIQFN